jgi:hypothetical protein
MWKFLQGASPADQATIPEGIEQIFVMSQNISDTQKEDLAWATYILLRNTNTIAVVFHPVIMYYFCNQTLEKWATWGYEGGRGGGGGYELRT